MTPENTRGLQCRFCGDIASPTGRVCGDRPDLAVVICRACGLTQLSDVSHVAESHYASPEYFPADLEAARRREVQWNRDRRRKILELLPESRSLRALDFGCGTGGFLSVSDGVFARIDAYDLSARVSELHKAAGYRCHHDLDAVPRDIDVILLFHVLEHIPDGVSFLRQLLRRFPAVRHLIIEVPNENEMLVSLFPSDEYARVHYSADHVYYFTPATLRRLVERAGLQVRLESQLQRYTLGNHLGWIAQRQGGGQDRWPFFADPELDEAYSRVLSQIGLADSIFMITDAAEACELGE